MCTVIFIALNQYFKIVKVFDCDWIKKKPYVNIVDLSYEGICDDFQINYDYVLYKPKYRSSGSYNGPYTYSTQSYI